MFAVKSEYCVQPSRDITIPFYVADNGVYFKRKDIANVIYGSLYGVFTFSRFENYDSDFVSFIECRNLFLENPSRFINRDFWRNIFNQDYSKVIAEVRDAQNFVKTWTVINLPENWSCLNIDWVINTLPSRTSDWIKKCYRSLQILATNDEQKQAARRVFDEAWKILKAREKAATADKRPTVHEVLAKVGLSDDDLIQAVLGVHSTKFANEQARRKAEFDNQHNQLEDDLRQLLE